MTDGVPTMCSERSGLVGRMWEENGTGEQTVNFKCVSGLNPAN